MTTTQIALLEQAELIALLRAQIRQLVETVEKLTNEIADATTS